MASSLTQEEAILRHLAITNAWIPSYDLNKVNLFEETEYETWIGDRGSRTARDLAETSQIQRERGKDLLASGIELDYKNRPLVPKYCYYHTNKALKQVGIYRTNPITGQKELLLTKYE